MPIKRWGPMRFFELGGEGKKGGSFIDLPGGVDRPKELCAECYAAVEQLQMETSFLPGVWYHHIWRKLNFPI